MGAKQSVSKKDLEESTSDKALTQTQDEHINDGELIDNHDKHKDSLLETCYVTVGQACLTDPTCDQLALKDKAANCSPTVVAAYHVEDGIATYSPKVKKREHNYEEITDEQLVSNQKVLDNKKEMESKKKENSKGKLGYKKKKKEKERKKDAEVLGCERLTDAAQTTPDQSPSTRARHHPYDTIDEEQLASNNNAKRAEMQRKANISPKVKNDKKIQNTVSLATETISHLAAPQHISRTVQAQRVPRHHDYDEILEEQLETNRKANLNKEEKSKKQDKSKEKVGNQNQKVKTDLEQIDSQKSSGGESQLSSGTESQNLKSRFHPYDEITEEDLASNWKVIKDIKGDKMKVKEIELAEQKKQTQVEESEIAEYLNAAAIAASSLPLPVREDNNKKEQEINEDITDIYAVPQKKLTKAKTPNELNYIEVDFSSITSKPEVKRSYSATNYASVITKDGKVILLKSEDIMNAT